MLTAVVFLFCICFVATAREGSGAEPNVWIEYKDLPVNLNYVNSLISDRFRERLNATLKVSILRAEEDIRNGRMGITLWSHLRWQLPFESPEEFWNEQTKIKINMDDKALLNVFPQTVFKNALYLQEHKTPLLNTVVHITKNGRFELHAKVTVDVPCIRMDSIPVVYGDSDICSQEITRGRSISSEDNVVCEMRYGSYIRDKTLLNLAWAFDAILDHSMPCSGEGISHCIIQEIQTLKRKITFAGEDFDELVACFLLNYRHIDRWRL